MAAFSSLSRQTRNKMPERKPEKEKIPLIFNLHELIFNNLSFRQEVIVFESIL